MTNLDYCHTCVDQPGLPCPACRAAEDYDRYLGECNAVLDCGGDARYDITCDRDAVIVLFMPPEWDGLALCERCYLRRQKRED